MIDALERVTAARGLAGAIVRGDARVLLASLPDRSVAAVITDPPYDDRTHNGAATAARPDQSPIDFAPVNGDLWFLAELLRVSRGWVICCCALEQLGAYQAAGGAAYVRGGVWRRLQTAPQMSGDRPAQAAEGVAILWAGSGRKAWNRGGFPAFWEVPIVQGAARRGHGSPKPEALGAAWALDFTAPGDLVLDPFCGVGGLVAGVLRAGRRALGCEIDPRYAGAAERRIAGVQVLPLHAARRPRAKQIKLEMGAQA